MQLWPRWLTIINIGNRNKHSKYDISLWRYDRQEYIYFLIILTTARLDWCYNQPRVINALNHAHLITWHVYLATPTWSRDDLKMLLKVSRVIIARKQTYYGNKIHLNIPEKTALIDLRGLTWDDWTERIDLVNAMPSEHTCSRKRKYTIKQTIVRRAKLG